MQRRQTAFHAEWQNLPGSTENSVQDLQQVHRKADRLMKDNNFSEKLGISVNEFIINWTLIRQFATVFFFFLHFILGRIVQYFELFI